MTPHDPHFFFHSSLTYQYPIFAPLIHHDSLRFRLCSSHYDILSVYRYIQPSSLQDALSSKQASEDYSEYDEEDAGPGVG